MPQDTLQSVLDSSGAPQTIKARAWDEFQASSDQADFQRRFDSILLPKTTKAKLWDMKFSQKHASSLQDTLAKERQQIGPKMESDPSLFSAKGIKSAAYSVREKALSALPAIGGTAGGIVGGVASLPSLPTVAGPVVGATTGAAIGGAAGKSVEKLLRSGLNEDTGTASERASDIGWEGVKQGVYELVGRGLVSLGGKVLPAFSKSLRQTEPALAKTEGEVIKGTMIPETSGQISGSGFKQSAERYLGKSFLGKSLQKVAEAQENASRLILGKLSGIRPASAGDLEANWLKARELTKAQADPIYDELKALPAGDAGKVAEKILGDDALRLSPKVKTGLAKATAGADDATARSLGYKDRAEAIKHVGEVAWANVEKQHAGESTGATIGDLLQARSSLRDSAMHAEGNERRLLNQAWRDLDEAINKSLTPEQVKQKALADRLWHRSYIMDDVAHTLREMERSQAPKDPQRIAPDTFVKLVNDLAHRDYTRVGGKVVAKSSDLDILFDNPEDRKAMVDLAQFLTKKYGPLTGSGGHADWVARLGPILAATGAAGAAVTGHEKTAIGDASGLAGLYLLANALANPGGARLLVRYFQSPVSAVGPLAIRIAAQSIGNQKPQSLPPIQ